MILGSSSFSASGIELSVTLSGKPTQQPASWRGWKTRPWIALLSGMTCSPSQADHGVGQWISSLLASRVSRGAQPGSASASMTPAGSGRPLRGSFAKWDRDSSFLKTSRLLFEEDYTTFSGLWPSSGSMRNGICFRRPRRVRRNAGSGCSFWPTATTANGNEQTAAEPTPGQTGGTTLAGAATAWGAPRVTTNSGIGSADRPHASRLEDQVTQWRSPSATLVEAKSTVTKLSGRTPQDPQVGLADQALAWATPAARDWKSGDASAETLARNARPLNEQVEHWGTPQAHERAQRPREVDHGVQLANQVDLWPTPTTPSQGGRATLTPGSQVHLETFVRFLPDLETPKDGAESSPTAPTSRRRLNPNFVDWLMGWPPGWSACAPLATASCPSRPLSPSQSSGAESMGGEA